jgi:glutamate--cysteine ligase
VRRKLSGAGSSFAWVMKDLEVGGAPVGVTDATPDAGPSVLRDCADAETHVGSVCFKHGPPRLLGVELEWLLHRPSDPAAPPDVSTLVAALGPHTPRSLDPSSPARPLPSGSTITIEPGGQVELASPPLPDLTALLQAVRADADTLHRMLAAHGLRPLRRATDPFRPPQRVLRLPRYDAMERSFDRRGGHGRSAMCSTAAVQVCVDPGERHEVGARWAAAHALGPVLLAAFANSPVLHGRRTGWKSSRWASWQRADPARCAPPPRSDVTGADPAGAWARRAVHSPVLAVRREREWLVPQGVTFADWIHGALPDPPTTADLDYHVTTLFPPVRPHGHLEIRYVDAQPGRRWALPVAVLAALLADPATIDRALEACEPAQERWTSAAFHGLGDRVLARAAEAVFALALQRLPAVGAPAWVLDDLVDMTEHQVLRGRSPADDALDDPVPDSADDLSPDDPSDETGHARSGQDRMGGVPPAPDNPDIPQEVTT